MGWAIVVIIAIAIVYLSLWAMSVRSARAFNSWLKRNTFTKWRTAIMKYKNMKKHSKSIDTFKWWMSLIGLFIIVALIGGLFSHFQFVGDAKEACTIGLEGDCEYDYNYFIPNGLRPLEILDLSKLGIDMKCECGSEENHIIISENFRRLLK